MTGPLPVDQALPHAVVLCVLPPRHSTPAHVARRSLGLSALVGSNMLRAYMHGFFMDMRLYHKAGGPPWNPASTLLAILIVMRTVRRDAWIADSRPFWWRCPSPRLSSSFFRNIVDVYFGPTDCPSDITHHQPAPAPPWRTPPQAKSLAEPSAYEDWRKANLKKKLEEREKKRIGLQVGRAGGANKLETEDERLNREDEGGEDQQQQQQRRGVLASAAVNKEIAEQMARKMGSTARSRSGCSKRRVWGVPCHPNPADVCDDGPKTSLASKQGCGRRH